MKTLTTSCLECGSAISFSGGEVGTWKDCPDCGHRTLLSPLNAVVSRTDRANYLALIRRSSCYPTLRMLVDVLAVVGLLGAVGYLVAGFNMAQTARSVGVSANTLIWPGVIAMTALGVVGSIVGRGLCLVLIDLADATLEANSRPQNTQARQASPGKD